MSNGLSAALPAAQAATQAVSSTGDQVVAPSWFVGLIAVGIVVLAALSLRRIIRPRKLRLDDTPGRPNNLNFMLVFAPFVLYLLAVLLADQLLQGRGVETRLAVSAGGMLLMLSAAAVVARIAFPMGLRGLGLSMRHWIYDSLRGLLAFLAVLPVCWMLLQLVLVLIQTFWPERLEQLTPPHELLRVMGQSGLVGQVLAVVIAVVLAPLAEEVVFRGLLQSWIRRATGQPWLAVAVASVIFSALHYSQPQALAPLLALSLVLGYNYERTGRLVAPILIHMLFNATFVLLVLTAGES